MSSIETTTTTTMPSSSTWLLSAVLAGVVVLVVGLFFARGASTARSGGEAQRKTKKKQAETGDGGGAGDAGAEAVAAAPSSTAASSTTTPSVAVTVEPLLLLKGHKRDVVCAAYSPDGRFVASVSDERTLRVWRVDSFARAPGGIESEQHTLTDDVVLLAWSPCSRAFAMATDDGRGACIVVRHVGGGVSSSSSSSSTKRWRVGKRWPLGPHTGNCSLVSLALSSEARVALTCSNDTRVALWRTAAVADGVADAAADGDGDSVTLLHSFSTAQMRNHGAALSPGAHGLIAVATRMSDVIVHRLRASAIAAGASGAATIEKLGVLAGHASSVYAVAFATDESLVLTLGKDATLRVWSLAVRFAAGEEPRTLASHTLVAADDGVRIDEHTRVRVASTGTAAYVVAVASDNVVALYSLHTHGVVDAALEQRATLRRRAVLAMHTRAVGSVRELSFDADARHVLTVAEDNRVRVFTVPECVRVE